MKSSTKDRQGEPPAASARDAGHGIDLQTHRIPVGMSDRFALGVTRLLRAGADILFAKRYGHRAIVLETVAAVPGMVGATIQHLNCLRRMVDDDGWIRTLMDEAENERMHLMTFIEIARPTDFERLVVLLAQWIFYSGFFLLYLISSRTAHRVVGYFEEEAVLSYTLYLAEIDAGRVPNVAAPAIAKRYWNLPVDATLRDVVLAVRIDEAHHRDVNHGFASMLGGDVVGHTHLAPAWTPNSCSDRLMNPYIKPTAAPKGPAHLMPDPDSLAFDDLDVTQQLYAKLREMREDACRQGEQCAQRFAYLQQAA